MIPLVAVRAPEDNAAGRAYTLNRKSASCLSGKILSQGNLDPKRACLRFALWLDNVNGRRWKPISTGKALKSILRTELLLMRSVYACLLLVMSASPVWAEGPTLREARQRWLHGNYEEARSIYEALAKDAKQKTVAAFGLSRTLQSQGEYDQALEVLDTALRENAASADLHAGRAELLYLRGRWSDALQAAEKALALKQEHFRRAGSGLR